MEPSGRQGESSTVWRGYQLIGSAIQMITTGYRVSDFRPDDTDEAIDIVIRFPDEKLEPWTSSMNSRSTRHKA